MTLAEYPQLQGLSIREKLELVDELWRDVSRGADRLEITPEEKELLDARWKEFLAAPQEALSLDEFKMQLKARRG